MSEPHIEVTHSDNHLKEIAHSYNCDAGPLAMPKHIHIGGRSWDGKPINNYADQVDEYSVWLEDSINNGDVAVMSELETIFEKAQGHGILLMTRCVPQPYITHAHAIKRCIMELAAAID